MSNPSDMLLVSGVLRCDACGTDRESTFKLMDGKLHCRACVAKLSEPAKQEKTDE